MKLRTVWEMAAVGALVLGGMAMPARIAAQGSETVLNASEAQKLLPPAVYFRGQSAPTQLRNSAGIKFANGNFLLATLVDTSGYSTAIASNYQAYLITEEPIKIGGERLPAGVYGVGFRSSNKFVVMDVGAHDLLSTSFSVDEGIKRPMPLQVLADPGGGFRLYEGRKYVHFSR
jgi:hypothetical protein